MHVCRRRCRPRNFTIWTPGSWYTKNPHDQGHTWLAAGKTPLKQIGYTGPPTMCSSRLSAIASNGESDFHQILLPGCVWPDYFNLPNSSRLVLTENIYSLEGYLALSLLEHSPSHYHQVDSPTADLCRPPVRG